jgi:hypothetical protein
MKSQNNNTINPDKYLKYTDHDMFPQRSNPQNKRLTISEVEGRRFPKPGLHD